MRLLLLLVLFLRLAPMPDGAAVHCGADVHDQAQEIHLAHQAGHDDRDHEECPHCPPTDCALQSHCPGTSGALFVAVAVMPTPMLDRSHPRTEPPRPWASRHARPPLRPPVSPLT